MPVLLSSPPQMIIPYNPSQLLYSLREHCFRAPKKKKSGQLCVRFRGFGVGSYGRDSRQEEPEVAGWSVGPLTLKARVMV